jgi:hypothetical protein
LSNGLWLEGCELVKNTDGSEFGHGARRCQEKLENVDGLADFGIGKVVHFANRLGSFEVDHLALVAEPLVQKLHHWLSQTRLVFCQFRSKSDQHDTSSRRFDHTWSAVLLNHLHQRHAVVAPHLVQQSNRVVLSHEVRVGSSHLCTTRATEAKAESTR